METLKINMKSNVLKTGSNNLNVENWKVYHPNGVHMFTCGEKKAMWYLDRDLAKKTSNDKITLNFEPKGYGHDTGEIFGRSIRKNICVVTGISEGLQRHHIVPYCYRSFFPEEYKSKNHHDIVLIHHKSHSDYELEATKYKDLIADMYGVETIKNLNTKYTGELRKLGGNNVILFNTIYSILKTYNRVSKSITYDKLLIISKYLGVSINVVQKYNYIQLYKLYLLLKNDYNETIINYKKNNRINYEHGHYIMMKLNTEEKMVDFVKLWRNHFINTMKPQYMPTGWSIDYKIKRNV